MTLLVAAAPAPASLRDHGQARWTRRHYALMAAIALLQMLIRAEVPLGQDMLWGARFGSDFLNTGHLASTDTYSWTAAGRTWIPNSWGWNVVLGAAYRAAGVVGFWLLGAALSLVLALVVARAAARIGAAPLATAACYAPIGLLGLAAVPRAQTVSTIAVLVIPSLTAALVSASGRVAAKLTAALAVFQVAWMNVHSGALLGPVLVLVCGAAVLVGRRSSRAVDWTRLLGAAGLTALACVLTPYGAALALHAGDVRGTSIGLVTEWDPVGFGSVAQVLGFGAVLGGATVSYLSWRAGRFATAAAVAVLTIATAPAIRFLPMLAVVGAAEIALILSNSSVRARMLKVMVAAVCVVLAVIAAANLRDLRSLGPTVSPGLVAEIPTGCRLLNDDLVGDAVTLLRPDVPVSLDGRYDMYGRALIVQVENLFNDRGPVDATLRRDNVRCILGPTSMPLVRRLSGDRRWTILAKDSVRTLLVGAPGVPS